jgi:protein-L-isoaspartate(D-aspartate) O-methyltransferase
MELRRSGVTDTRLLSAMERIPRELFVPATFRDQAYENTALPVGHGQTLSQPTVVATMSQALEVGPRMKVLEIGTGTGYQTAILALLCRRVYSIERHRPLLVEAEERLKALRLHNVTVRHGDGWQGWPEQAPFDRIIVTAAPPEIPKQLFAQLAEGGIMVLPLGGAKHAQRLTRIRRSGETMDSEDIGPVRFVPLVGGLPGAS